MTEEPAGASRPNPDRSPPRATIEPAEFARKRDFLPLLYLAGFVVLAGSLVYLWQNPPPSKTETQQAGRVDTLQGQIAALRDQVSKLSEPKPAGANPADVAKLQEQVNALQNRPSVAPDALTALNAKVAALEAKPVADPAALTALASTVAALEAKPVADPAAVQHVSDKVAALEARRVATPEQLALLSDQVQKVGRASPDVKPLEQKVSALEQRPVYDPAAVNGKLTDLSGTLGQAQEVTAKLTTQVNGIDTRQAALGDQLKALTQRAQITARLQGMAAALAAGQKLGDIPGAPPALARFANEAPPTEASLRESFDRYADAAQKASQPAITDKQDFGARLWTRAQQAVTVRQGDRVLVGDPIAGVITHAREKLENGDLAGSVEALKGLAGPAAAAMQPWTDRAQALVAARSAIASLAAN